MNETQLWPIVVYFTAVIVVAAGMIGLSCLLGQRHSEAETGEQYESGILATGSAHMRVSAKFYLVAVFFVIFDLESVFIFAWAVSVRQMGWAGYVEVLVFVGVLLAALAYLWRLGALDWSGESYGSVRGRRKRKASNEIVDQQTR